MAINVYSIKIYFLNCLLNIITNWNIKPISLETIKVKLNYNQISKTSFLTVIDGNKSKRMIPRSHYQVICIIPSTLVPSEGRIAVGRRSRRLKWDYLGQRTIPSGVRARNAANTPASAQHCSPKVLL